MAVCYITQLEIYPSNPHLDTLDIAKVQDAVNLLEDLNYIRSVIKAILGSSATKWNDTAYIPNRNITKIWEAIGAINGRGTVGGVIGGGTGGSTPVVTPENPTGGDELVFAIQGFISKTPVFGEISYKYIATQDCYIRPSKPNSVIGQATAVIPPYKESSGGVDYLAQNVAFEVKLEDGSTVAQFVFEENNPKADIVLIAPNVFLRQTDVLNIVPVSQNMQNISDISFYINLTTKNVGSDYPEYARSQISTFIPYLSKILNKLDSESSSPDYKIMEVKYPSSLRLEKQNLGYARTTKAPTAETIFKLKKNNVDIGTITFAANSVIGVIELNTNSSYYEYVEFNPLDVLSIHAYSTNSSVLTNGSCSTLTGCLSGMEDVAIGLKTHIKLIDKILGSRTFLYTPGKVYDSKILFSGVSYFPSDIEANKIKLTSQNVINKQIDLTIYKNNERIGSAKFLPNTSQAQVVIPKIEKLSNGDFLHIKSEDNTTASDVSDLQNINFEIFYQEQKEEVQA